MAHPKRKEWAEELSKQLLDAPIIYDEKQNIWDTCRRSWLLYDRDAEYHLVIQDDAILCYNFIEKAKQVLRTGKIFNEDYIYSFYAGEMMKNHIIKAEKKRRNYVISGMIFNEVALCMKTEHIKGMVKFCDDREVDTDQEVARWARIKLLKVFYTIPSLVDHREGESLYRVNYNKPNPDKQRKAFRFIDKK